MELTRVFEKSIGAFLTLNDIEQEEYTQLSYRRNIDKVALTPKEEADYQLLLNKLKAITKSIKIDPKRGGLRGEFCFKCKGKKFSVQAHDPKRMGPDIMRLTCKECGTILKLCHKDDLK